MLSRKQSKSDLGGWIQKKRLGVIKDKCICLLLHALRNTLEWWGWLLGWEVGLSSFLPWVSTDCLGLGSALFWVPQGREDGCMGVVLEVVKIWA